MSDIVVSPWRLQGAGGGGLGSVGGVSKGGGPRSEGGNKGVLQAV